MRLGCRSVAFTYNDPVIFLEYAVDVADACRARGIKAVAVTAGYIGDEPRRELFAHMDAANVDLKAFTEDFYHRVSAGHLQPVLDTLVYLRHEHRRLVRDHHAADPRAQRLGRRDRRRVRVDRRQPRPRRPAALHRVPSRLQDARRAAARRRRRCAGPADIALRHGLRYVYTGNVHDVEGGRTICPGCGAVVVERDWYVIGATSSPTTAVASAVGLAIPGRYDGPVGRWGARRLPVSIAEVGGSSCMKLRPAAVAGRFYPADPVELATSVDAAPGRRSADRPPAGRPDRPACRLPVLGSGRGRRLCPARRVPRDGDAASSYWARRISCR